MFYRRKVLLALLQLFGGRLDKVRLQKLLFLFTRMQPLPEYDFVPYKYGCYSFSANADLSTMIAKGLLVESKNGYIKNDGKDYLTHIKVEDRERLQRVKADYGRMSTRALVKHTYIKYPFFATRSEVAADFLDKRDLEKVEASISRNSKAALFTIGYEGISLESYLVRLLLNDVRVLVDVRNTPLSMKYGFSKNQLKRYCESLGINYVHIPELGIEPKDRRHLNTQADYDKLFQSYRQRNLTKTKDQQMQILELLMENQRVALTCFEANICQCHRKHLAEAIEKLPGFVYPVVHI